MSESLLNLLTVDNGEDASGACFIAVIYGGDKKTLVNADCAILHLLLHLRAKYVGEGFSLPDEISIQGCRPREKPHSPHAKGRRKTLRADQEAEEGELYLDLLDGGASPVELCNQDPLTTARPFLAHRSEYILCTVRKCSNGAIKEANPLLTEPSMDLKRRIDAVLRTMERFKSRNERNLHFFCPVAPSRENMARKKGNSHSKRMSRAR